MDGHSVNADILCCVLSDSESSRIGSFHTERQKQMIRFLTNGTQFYSFERIEIYQNPPMFPPQYKYRICQYLSDSDLDRGRHSTMWEGHSVDHVRERWANLIGRGFASTEYPLGSDNTILTRVVSL